MELLVLYDNRACRRPLKSGWGFSCLLDRRLLFDTGEKGDALLFNMKALGVDAAKIERVVISHEHWDHTGGLEALLKLRPGLPVVACSGFSRDFAGQVRRAGGSLHLTKGPEKIGKHFVVTGEIQGTHRGQSIPEQALIVQTAKGLTVITGCAHPGLLAILDSVAACFPGYPVSLLLGGFHLKGKPAGELREIADQLKKRQVMRVGPTHCSGDEAGTVFHAVYGRHCFDVCSGFSMEI